MVEVFVHSAADLRTPVLAAVNNLARSLLGIELTILCPTRSGWSEARNGTPHSAPDFCRLVQNSREGARHCRMCHVLMSVAAADSGSWEQRCHAGASVLVAPIRNEHEESNAVLSSCICSGPTAEPEVRARAGKLGIDAQALVAAFRRLHRLPVEQMELAKTLLKVASLACGEALARLRLEKRLHEQSRHHDQPSAAVLALQEAIGELNVSAPQQIPPATSGRRGTSHVVTLVADLIAERPHLPFSVNELAAASRMTRSHFSKLFRERVGRSFSTYVAERRIALAKELLRNPMLNISEVGGRCGYDDPGYFSRRFRQATGLSPRVWREQCVVSPASRATSHREALPPAAAPCSAGTGRSARVSDEASMQVTDVPVISRLSDCSQLASSGILGASVFSPDREQ